MRLIDADALMKFIQDGLNNPDKEKAFGHDAVEILGEIHVMSTIELVRCKDCKYWTEERDIGMFCNHWGSMLAETHGDDFCSYAERKE